MKLLNSKLMVIFTAMIAAISICSFSAEASPRMYITGIPANPKVGEVFTVTLVLEGANNLRAIDFSLTYNSSVLEAVDGDQSASGVNTLSKLAFGRVENNEILEGFEKSDRALAAGEIRFTASNKTPLQISSTQEIAV